MKLLGKDVSVNSLLGEIEFRLRERGLLDAPHRAFDDPPDTAIDPLTFTLTMLERYTDATSVAPVAAERASSLGKLRAITGGLVRRSAQWALRDVFARQTRFNSYARDGYAQLSAEVLALRREVERLKKSS
jgi:hypothetical protein